MALINVRLSRCVHIPISIGVAALLSGCASTLPAEEATAFRTLATADKSAFDGVVDTELAVGLERSQRLLAGGDGLVTLKSCKRDDTVDCTVSYNVANTEYQLIRSAPNTRALLGAIVRYADAMAELAEAKDLDTVKSKAEGAAGAVKSLAALTPVGAIAAPIIDALTFAGDQQLRGKRRRALLRVATAARGPIAGTVTVLTEESNALKQSVLAGGSENIAATQASIIKSQQEERALLNGQPLAQARLTQAQRERVGVLRAERAAALARLVDQSQQIGSARKLGAEWGKLNKAHDALIAKLQNPKLSIEDAMADIDAVLVLLDGIKGAAKSEG